MTIDELKQLIDLVVYENEEYEITATNVNDLLKKMVDFSKSGALENKILASTNVGYIKQGDILNSGTTFEEIFRTMLSKELDVTGVPPSITIHNSGAANGDKEIGTTFNVDLSVEYHDGYFKAENSWGADQPAGCASGTTKYYKNDVVMAGNTDSHKFTSEATVKYKAKTGYGASTITPKTNYGNDSTVKITAGTAQSSEIKFNGYYRYYYIVNTATQLTASNTFDECKNLCTSTGLLASNVTVLDSEGKVIGDATTKKYVYVLIPKTKNTPTFKDAYGAQGTMTVIKDTYTHNGITYKLCTLNKDGNSGDKYKECKIIK